jgi:hypothetical protein
MDILGKASRYLFCWSHDHEIRRLVDICTLPLAWQSWRLSFGMDRRQPSATDILCHVCSYYFTPRQSLTNTFNF